MNQLELKIPPIALLFIFASVMWLMPPLINWTDITFLSKMIALLAAVSGMVFCILGVAKFRENETTVDPRYPDKSEHLVIDGIYQYTRNPMYVGFALVLTAEAAAMQNAGAVFLVFIFIAYMQRFQIIPEERILKDKFGDAYDRYTAKVARWIVV